MATVVVIVAVVTVVVVVVIVIVVAVVSVDESAFVDKNFRKIGKKSLRSPKISFLRFTFRTHRKKLLFHFIIRLVRKIYSFFGKKKAFMVSCFRVTMSRVNYE